MVKEVNFGEEKGAHQLSLVTLPRTGPLPACSANNAHEHIIPWQKWSGYYSGKVGGAFFFDADDGTNGGMPFVAYTASAHEILRDSTELAERGAFRSIHWEGATLVVRYRRAWLAPCSMYTDPAGCWALVAARTGLPKAAQPDCRDKYEAEIKRAANSKYDADIAKSESVIGYEVEARATPGKTTFSPLAGRVTCWISD